MDSTSIEILLERLVDINLEILSAIQDVKFAVEDIKEEVDWVTEHSSARMILDKLTDVSIAVDSISSSVTSIELSS